jgi:hypothetical protein
MEDTATELDALKARTIAGIYRCLAMLAAGIARDHLSCGKAACLRSGRCRGFACEPDIDDGDEPATGGPH